VRRWVSPFRKGSALDSFDDRHLRHGRHQNFRRNLMQNKEIPVPCGFFPGASVSHGAPATFHLTGTGFNSGTGSGRDEVFCFGNDTGHCALPYVLAGSGAGSRWAASAATKRRRLCAAAASISPWRAERAECSSAMPQFPGKQWGKFFVCRHGAVRGLFLFGFVRHNAAVVEHEQR
jgi:hypothetical protein